ncbi:MAG: hypothetical protein QM536_02940 [Chitinophagaceae bacterium]|nr:hypothetical protein [Chitinophagaceae bacterium]
MIKILVLFFGVVLYVKAQHPCVVFGNTLKESKLEAGGLLGFNNHPNNLLLDWHRLEAPLCGPFSPFVSICSPPASIIITDSLIHIQYIILGNDRNAIKYYSTILHHGEQEYRFEKERDINIDIKEYQHTESYEKKVAPGKYLHSIEGSLSLEKIQRGRVDVDVTIISVICYK